jgi:hypothetical protein
MEKGGVGVMTLGLSSAIIYEILKFRHRRVVFRHNMIMMSQRRGEQFDEMKKAGRDVSRPASSKISCEFVSRNSAIASRLSSEEGLQVLVVEVALLRCRCR